MPDAEQIPADVLDEIAAKSFIGVARLDYRHTVIESWLAVLDAIGYLHPGLKPCPECGAGAGEACEMVDAGRCPVTDRGAKWPCPNADRRHREGRP